MAGKRELEYILSLQDTTKKGFDQLDRRLKNLDDRFEKVGRTSTKSAGLATKALTAVGTALAGVQMADFAKESVTAFAQFEKGLALVGTLSDEAFGKLPSYKADLEDLSKASGQTTEALTKGLFDVVSATGEAEQAMSVLAAATDLAIAGGADVAVTTDGVTTSLNAFGLAAGEATRVSNALFEAQQFGKTTVGELAANLGQISPSAKAAGADLGEMLGTLAAATRQLPTNIAATSLARFFDAVALASDDVKEKSREMAAEAGVVGFEFSRAGLQADGLAVFLQKLSRVIGDDNRKLVEFGLAAESMKGANVVLQNSAADATEAIAKQRDGVDELGKGVSRMAGTTSAALDRLAQAWEDAKRAFGESLVGDTTQDIDKLTKAVEQLATAFGRAGRAGSRALRLIGAASEGDMGGVLGALVTGPLDAVAFGDDARRGVDWVEDYFNGRGSLNVVSGGESRVNTDAVRERAQQQRMAEVFQGVGVQPDQTPGAISFSKGFMASARLSEKEQKEIERAEKERIAAEKRFNEEIKRLREDSTHERLTAGMKGRDKELADTWEYFRRLRDQHTGNADRIAQIREEERRKVEAINAKYNARERSEQGERDADLLSDREDFAKQTQALIENARIDFSAIGLGESGQAKAQMDKRLAESRRFFDDLIAEAERLGLETTDLEQARQESLATISADGNRRLLDIEERAAEDRRRLAERERREADRKRRELADEAAVNDPGAGAQRAVEQIEESLKPGRVAQQLTFDTHAALSDSLFDIATNAKSAGDAFRDFGKSVAASLLDIAAQQTALFAIQGLFSLLGLGGIGGPAAGAAGAATGGGGGAPFGGVLNGLLNRQHAKGGIADRPSIFGEAGPEAAVPLPDGRRIPVKLSGGTGGVTVQVTQHIAPQLIDAKGAEAVLARSAKHIGDIVTDQLGRNANLRRRTRDTARGR